MMVVNCSFCLDLTVTDACQAYCYQETSAGQKGILYESDLDLHLDLQKKWTLYKNLPYFIFDKFESADFKYEDSSLKIPKQDIFGPKFWHFYSLTKFCI